MQAPAIDFLINDIQAEITDLTEDLGAKQYLEMVEFTLLGYQVLKDLPPNSYLTKDSLILLL